MTLHVLHPDVTVPPPDRGRLLTSAQVAALVGGVSPAWVRRYVPHKLTLGGSTVRWYEADIRAWLELRRDWVIPRQPPRTCETCGITMRRSKTRPFTYRCLMCQPS